MPVLLGLLRCHRGCAAAALVALALSCAAGLLYFPTAGYDFVTLDDLAYVRDNPFVRDGLTARGAASAFRIQQNTWIPLTWLSFMAEISAAGMKPRVFHATNLLLHSAAMALLLLVLWRMTGALWPSALAAALVALHPLRVESVAWITERKDTLSMLFLLMALACWLRRLRTAGARWYVATAACFALSLGAKPMPLTFPLLLLALDYWPLGRLEPVGRSGPGVSRLVIEKLPLLALSAADAAITLAGRSRELPPLAMPDRIGMLLAAPLIYLGRTFWPVNLGIRYFQNGQQPGPALSLASALALAALTFLLLRAGRVRP